MDNPYAAPQASLSNSAETREYDYAGFWLRTAASLIDGIAIVLITFPLSLLVYGVDEYLYTTSFYLGPADLVINYGLPAVLTILFWLQLGATPGKMLLKLKVVDARTGQRLTLGKAILRYFGYFLSALLLGIGYFCVGWDKRKQGLHDKLAGTLVLKAHNGKGTPQISFAG
ncbi:RDD family protein [Chitinilyticum litopenaei]|uniref:RDD family protein n=1 Tax=Chitinilyticum litopenaei TaxID=1121276 RepID=UPI0004191698|nr:RDD family protein [Chitinilyticum litopenaei]